MQLCRTLLCVVCTLATGSKHRDAAECTLLVDINAFHQCVTVHRVSVSKAVQSLMMRNKLLPLSLSVIFLQGGLTALDLASPEMVSHLKWFGESQREQVKLCFHSVVVPTDQELHLVPVVSVSSNHWGRGHIDARILNWC